MPENISAPMSDPTTYLDYDDCRKLEFTPAKVRDMLAIFFLFHCGMRVHEVVQLRKKDIIIEDDPRESVVIATGKGSRKRAKPKRRIPLDMSMQQMLDGYISNFSEDDWIFPSPYKAGRHLTVRWAQYILDKTAEKARVKYDKGGKKVHPHTLRHSLAIFLIKRGVALPKIQHVLGHSSLASTGYYLQFSHKEIAEDYHEAFKMPQKGES